MAMVLVHENDFLSMVFVLVFICSTTNGLAVENRQRRETSQNSVDAAEVQVSRMLLITTGSVEKN